MKKCPIYTSGKHHFGWDFKQVMLAKDGSIVKIGYPSCKCGIIDDRKQHKKIKQS